MIDLSKAVKLTDDDYFPKLEPFEYPIIDVDPTLTYKDAVEKAMTKFGEEGAVFIGYNVARGDAMGTLKGVPFEQKIETPVAENLMMGLAIGLSFEGFKPVVYFERHDFMLVAMDAIVNHLDKIERISHGEFKVPVIVRAIAADSGPFYSGITHSQDFTELLKAAVTIPVIEPTNGPEVINAFRGAALSGRPAIIIEKKSRY